MITTSENFNNRISRTSRRFAARILSGGSEISCDIKSVKIYKGACGENAFLPGSVYSSYIEAVVDNLPVNIENEELELQIGLYLDDGTVEYVPIGLYTVTKPKSSAYQTTFTAAGRIVSKLSVIFTPPALVTVPNILAAITAQTGVQITLKGLTASGTIQESLTGITCRDVLGVVASVLGGFATEDNTGGIVISKFTADVTAEYTCERMLELPTFNEYDYSVSGVKVIVSDATEDEDGNTIPEVSYSSGTPNLVLENAYMTQALFSAFAANVTGFTYRPGTVPLSLGDPRLEPWDCLKITDVKGDSMIVPCMNIVHSFDGGVSTLVTAPGESESDTDTAGPLTKAVKRMAAELLTAEQAIFKRLRADEAELTYAKITTLDAESARIDSITGELSSYKEYVGGKFTGLEADFQELSSTTIKTTELAAEVAKLGYVESDELTAKIAELGYLTADSADLKYAALGDFNAVSGRVGTLEGDFSSFVTGEFGTLKSGVADIQTLMFGSASGNSITIEFANAVASMIGDGYITNAMIDNLSFDKITGFDVNTTNVTVHSQDGKSTWSDNTIVISDGTHTRVQIGKDASNDYNMYVWDASGNLMFDALGLTESGIKRDIIKDSMVASDAAINASKLDIDSLFRVVNEDGSHTLNATKVYFSAEEQTLDVLFNSMTTDIEGAKGDASSALTQITAINGQISTVIQNMESMGSELSATKTMAEQTADKFTWLVASGTNSADFTLTDRAAQLTAEKINLKGLVTFSGLHADAQSKVNTAVSNAASALGTATAANDKLLSWCAASDQTLIDGAKIYTGSITASQINVDSLQSNLNRIGNASGQHVLIDSDSFDIKKSDTLLASFQADKIELGKNSLSSVIEMVGGKFNISYNDAATLDESFGTIKCKGSMRIIPNRLTEDGEFNGARAELKLTEDGDEGVGIVQKSTSNGGRQAYMIADSLVFSGGAAQMDVNALTVFGEIDTYEPAATRSNLGIAACITSVSTSGNWTIIKLSNNIKIQYATIAYSASSFTAYGNLYYKDFANATFPVAFSSVPQCFLSTNKMHAWFTPHTVTATYVTPRAFGVNSGAKSGNYFVLAIGK